MVLACHPEMEASVYQTARTNAGVFDSARSLDIPVTVMRAMEPGPDRDPTDFSVSPTWPGLVGEFRHGREFHLADCTHFIPMQMPDRVVAQIQAQMEQWGADRS